MVKDKWYIVDRDTGVPLAGPWESSKDACEERGAWEIRGTNRNLWVTRWGTSKSVPEPEPETEPETYKVLEELPSGLVIAADPPCEEWYASTNGEHYTTGPFVSREAVIKEMTAVNDETQFWTGRGVQLRLKDLIHVCLSNLEERASEVGSDIVGEYIEDWNGFGLDKETAAKAEAEIEEAIVDILKKYGAAEPSCYKIVDDKEYTGEKE